MLDTRLLQLNNNDFYMFIVAPSYHSNTHDLVLELKCQASCAVVINSNHKFMINSIFESEICCCS